MDEFDTALGPLLERDPRFHRDAYHFVREALYHTQATLARETGGMPRHVSGHQLLEGIRSLALQQFGPMALAVLSEWGIHRCEDFGDIVFNLVGSGILSKTDDDRPEDFRGGYDFQEAFRRPFLQGGTACPATGSSRE